MTVVRIKPRFQVTIPSEIRESLPLAEGDLLEITTDGRTIVLVPKAAADRAALDAELDEAVADIAQGRGVGPFDSVGAFKAAIEKE